MADNSIDPSAPRNGGARDAAGGSNKKAGLTKPERLTQRRSLAPPPPAAVQAARQKSLPPVPAVDVTIDDESEEAEHGDGEHDDATIVQDRAAFAGFFDAEENDDGASSPGVKDNPWTLPPVVPRPPVEARTSASEALAQVALEDGLDASRLDASQPENPLPAVPVDAGIAGSDPVLPVAMPALSTDGHNPAPFPNPAHDPIEMREPGAGMYAFAGKTEQERTEEVEDVEDITIASNEKPEPPRKDDLESLFAGKAKPSPSGILPLGNAPPPPPSLRPPAPPLKAGAPPPPSGSAPAPLLDAPVAVLPEPFDGSVEVPRAMERGLPPAAPNPSYLPPPPPPTTSSSLPPLPAPPLPSPMAQPSPQYDAGGLNYADDDDVTQIFDRGDSMPPPGHSSAPPSGMGLRLPSFAPPPASSVLTFSDPVPSAELKLYQRPKVLGAIAAVLFLGVLALTLWPRSGRLVVAVAGPNNTVVDGITISVDGKVVCTESPCQLDDLEPRGYLVAVLAEGFERTAPHAVTVESGKDAVYNVSLQAPIVVAPTGIDIPASGPGFTVSVDGKSFGSLPQKVLDLTPGEHVVRVSGGDRYRDEEKTVTVSEGQIVSLPPFELEVKRGRAVIEAGANAEDANVELDGKTIRLPHTTDLDTSRTHRLVATREGFEEFQEELSFERGKAERTFTVRLEPLADADGGDEAAAEVDTTKARAGASRRSPPRSSPPAASGKGTLNITSSPSAMVILDGRPIGKTPKTGIKVSPGAHSIVFVSDKGRKRATTKVAAGDTKTVSVRF